MPPSRRRRKKSKSAPLGPAVVRGLVVAFALVAVLVGALLVARSDAGLRVLADRGVPAGLEWMRPRLDDAIRHALLAQGVAPDSLRVVPATADALGLIRCGTDVSLRDLNLAVTMAVEDVGGTVRAGRRVERDGGTDLELRIGTASTLTHRVVARRGPVPAPPAPEPRARLAIVLDDLGHNLNGLTRRALDLEAPVTFAVLPNLSRSVRMMTELERRGKSVLLHMPMEAAPPRDGEKHYDAGEPQIRVGMAPAEIHSAVESALAELGAVVGLNNHMGSLATRHRAEMNAVMEVLVRRGLVFLDSQTTPHSVAHVAADEHGVPYLRNDIFLDAPQLDAASGTAVVDRALVLERLEQLVDKALSRGYAVGIGHVNESMVAALEAFLPDLAGRGVELVPLEQLIHERSR